MYLLPTAYFPDISYFSILLKNTAVSVEIQDHFVKQSMRNRCFIASPQGKLGLTIPLTYSGNKTLTREKKISFAENWQLKHWRAIESAYRKSAYFEYFEEEIKLTIFQQTDSLIEFNHLIIQTLLKILRKPDPILFTRQYEENFNGFDFRDESKLKSYIRNFPGYYQVFSTKTGFISDLSILDLIFNEGLKSIDYISNLSYSSL